MDPTEHDDMPGEMNFMNLHSGPLVCCEGWFKTSSTYKNPQGNLPSSSVVKDSMLPLQEAQAQSLVGELRSHIQLIEANTNFQNKTQHNPLNAQVL